MAVKGRKINNQKLEDDESDIEVYKIASGTTVV